MKSALCVAALLLLRLQNCSFADDNDVIPASVTQFPGTEYAYDNHPSTNEAILGGVAAYMKSQARINRERALQDDYIKASRKRELENEFLESQERLRTYGPVKRKGIPTQSPSFYATRAAETIPAAD